MDNNKSGTMVELGTKLHTDIEHRFKIEDRVKWLLENCSEEDKEYYSNFKVNGIVEDILNDLKEAELTVTLENIDSAFDGLWE